MTDRHWRQRAACVGTNPDMWYSRGPIRELCRRICQGCPVLTECRSTVFAEETAHGEGALDNRNHRHGFRAGMTETQRWAMVYPAEAAQVKDRDRLRSAGYRARQAVAA